MGIIQASIPLFFVLIAAELLFTQLGRRSFYRLHDSVSDLSAGTLSQIAGMFTKLFLVGSFGYMITRESSAGLTCRCGRIGLCSSLTQPAPPWIGWRCWDG